MSRFEGKVAIVTGASAGIGESIAHRLGEEGAGLVLVARRAEELERVRSEVSAPEAALVVGSVTDPATAESAVATAEDLGGVAVLVNNAAVDHVGDVIETPADEIREVIETNYLGQLWMLQHAGRAMRARGGGSIVNVTSRLASIGIPGMGIYAASKGALLALTRNAAVELARDGIRVNAVAPGFVETPLFQEWLHGQDDPAAVLKRSEELIPQRRLARPEEVAAAVAFLASDEAAHITGVSLPIDGGYTAA